MDGGAGMRGESDTGPFILGSVPVITIISTANDNTLNSPQV